MNCTTVVQILVGVIGVLVTYGVAQPGEYILKLGALRFDPSLAAIAGFSFIVVWGIAMSLRRSTAFQAGMESCGFNPTVVAITLGFCLFSAVLTYMETDLTGVSLIATMLVNILITVVGIASVFILFRHFGWWYPGSENRV